MARTVAATYYDILGVAPDATTEQITTAYNAKRRDAHPDRGGSPELWRMLQGAYETLTDTAARAQYDEILNKLSGTVPTPHREPARESGSRPQPGPAGEQSTDRRPHDHHAGASAAWIGPDGPAQVYYPPIGVPVPDNDPRLKPAPRRHLAARVAKGIWWALGATLEAGVVALMVALVLTHRATGTSAVANVLLSSVVTLLPQGIARAVWKSKVRAVHRWNDAVRAGDAALDTAWDSARSATKTWGKAGTVSVGRFGPNATIGNRGELSTATDLAAWMDHVPAARVLHGLHWPGTAEADIDHVVIVGNRIAVIDTKTWGPGTYYSDAKGTWRDGRLMPDLKVADAGKALREFVSMRGPGVPVEVRCWVLIRGDGVYLEGPGVPGASIVTVPQLRDQLAHWLVRTNPCAAYVDRRLLTPLVRLLK